MTSVWATLLLLQRRVRRDGLLLPLDAAAATASPVDPPRVTVIVPVRDNAAGARRALRSILDQAGIDLEVVVVDDRSAPPHRHRLARMGASDPRVRRLRIDRLPDGWLGKSHALWTAARTSDAEWLLLLDDDCMLEPGAIAAAVRSAADREVELLTLWPRHRGGSLAEHLAIPLCGAVIAMWFSGRERTTGRHFANGQFILVTRDAYERIGGHAAVRAALIEDVALADVAARHGIRSLVASGRDLFSVRMYHAWTGVRDGWARIFAGALRGGARIGLSIAWLLATSLLPCVLPMLLLLAFLAPHDAATTAPRLWLALAAPLQVTMLLGVMLLVSWRFWGFGGCARRYLALYPVSVVLVVVILARAWWWLVIRRRITWRNTSYRIDRRARIVA